MKKFINLMTINLLTLFFAHGQSNEVAKVTRISKDFDKIISPDTKAEKVASNFIFTEGPLWHSEGYLIFSDIPANRIYKLDASGKATVFMENSGYTGTDSPTGEIGSNGLGYDREGRLLLCQHGNRQLVRIT